jgi:hypothetical protein
MQHVKARRHGGWPFPILVLLVTLGGCSDEYPSVGRTSAIPLKAASSGWWTNRTDRLIFVAENTSGSGGYVLIYSQAKGHPIVGTLQPDPTFSPVHIAVDTKGNVYVVDSGSVDQQLDIFAPGSTTPTVIPLVNPPEGVAVAPNGNFAVSQDRSVVVNLYQSEAVYPCNVVSDMNTSWGGVGSVALDRDGHLYVIDTYQQLMNVQRVVGGCRATTFEQLNLRGLVSPSDIGIDPSGNLGVLDQNAAQIDIYPPGATNPSGRARLKGMSAPLGFTWGDGGHSVWVGGCIARQHSSCNAQVGKYVYPGGGAVIDELPLPPPSQRLVAVDVAAFPPVAPGER